MPNLDFHALTMLLVKLKKITLTLVKISRSRSRKIFLGWQGNQIRLQNPNNFFYTCTDITFCNMHYILLKYIK